MVEEVMELFNESTQQSLNKSYTPYPTFMPIYLVISTSNIGVKNEISINNSTNLIHKNISFYQAKTDLTFLHYTHLMFHSLYWMPW